MNVEKNKKDFKVLKMKASEVMDVFRSPCICDFCNSASKTDEGFGGYFIAVLNSVYCQECYDRFIETAKNYKEDQRTENFNFERVLTNARNLNYKV